jgi:hypothetical protein
MVVQLRAKPGGKHISVTLGNFADMAVEGRFTLIFCVGLWASEVRAGLALQANQAHPA